MFYLFFKNVKKRLSMKIRKLSTIRLSQISNFSRLLLYKENINPIEAL